MTPTEKAEKVVNIAAKLYEARTRMRRIWGTEYEAKIAANVAGIQKIADASGKTRLEVGMDAARRAIEAFDSEAATVILAATVEAIERD